MLPDVAYKNVDPAGVHAMSPRVAVPPGLAFFKAEKSFSHGGAALQELVIPHLVSRGHAPQGKRVAIEIVLPTFELQRPAVKVTVRVAASPSQKDAQQSLSFSESGRTLSLEVLRRAADGTATTVLASKAKELRIEPKDKEQSVTLFFHTAQSFQKGELLELYPGFPPVEPWRRQRHTRADSRCAHLLERRVSCDSSFSVVS